MITSGLGNIAPEDTFDKIPKLLLHNCRQFWLQGRCNITFSKFKLRVEVMNSGVKTISPDDQCSPG
jgi:hypothetical protein